MDPIPKGVDQTAKMLGTSRSPSPTGANGCRCALQPDPAKILPLRCRRAYRTDGDTQRRRRALQPDPAKGVRLRCILPLRCRRAYCTGRGRRPRRPGRAPPFAPYFPWVLKSKKHILINNLNPSFTMDPIPKGVDQTAKMLGTSRSPSPTD